MYTVSETSRLTISLPTGLLEVVDQKLVQPSESRSAVIRRLLEGALRDLEEQEDLLRWTRGYEEDPQTNEELGWVDQVSGQALAHEPWE
jgi:hypothetical protein